MARANTLVCRSRRRRVAATIAAVALAAPLSAAAAAAAPAADPDGLTRVYDPVAGWVGLWRWAGSAWEPAG